jgi:sucrose phosphorylase
MGRSEHEYLLARAIQFFLPGIPQVYYVGLLAGGNDMDLLARTGVGRDINRHYFDEAEVLEALRRPVVRDLMALASLRNTHPAFAGEFACELTGGGELRLSWSRRDDHATLCVDFARGEGELELSAFVVDGQPRPVTRRAFRSSHPTP